MSAGDFCVATGWDGRKTGKQAGKHCRLCQAATNRSLLDFSVLNRYLFTFFRCRYTTCVLCATVCVCMLLRMPPPSLLLFPTATLCFVCYLLCRSRHCAMIAANLIKLAIVLQLCSHKTYVYMYVPPTTPATPSQHGLSNQPFIRIKEFMTIVMKYKIYMNATLISANANANVTVKYVEKPHATEEQKNVKRN